MRPWQRASCFMKRSDSGRNRTMGRSALLVVDGYNLLPALFSMPLTKLSNLELARQELIHRLIEYAAFADEDVLVVFDAHHTGEQEKSEKRRGVEIIFTAKGETADERIERLIPDLLKDYRTLTVATSDALEQQITFGGGALRISAREMVEKLNRIQEKISEVAKKTQVNLGRDWTQNLSDDILKKLEAWRRSQKDD